LFSEFASFGAWGDDVSELVEVGGACEGGLMLAVVVGDGVVGDDGVEFLVNELSKILLDNELVFIFGGFGVDFGFFVFDFVGDGVDCCLLGEPIFDIELGDSCAVGGV